MYDLGEPSSCVLLGNMFDPQSVDLKKDPFYFINIKEEVINVCSEWGKVDKVHIEQKSPGLVYIRFRGAPEKAVGYAEATVKALNGKTFDERPITAKFVPEQEFSMRIIER
jgi:hypothetical protein